MCYIGIDFGIIYKMNNSHLGAFYVYYYDLKWIEKRLAIQKRTFNSLFSSVEGSFYLKWLNFVFYSFAVIHFIR